MGSQTTLTKNLRFWHWYPTLITEGLTAAQLRWQPDGHDTTILFATWHAYRAADELVHGPVMQRPSVFAAQGWSDRLPVERIGVSPFGNGATRGQIASVDVELPPLLDYAIAVGESIIDCVESMSGDEAAAEVELPFFTGVYPDVDRMSRLEAIVFFAIGHTSEHLGEVQMLKGMGLKGAPL